MDYEAHVDTNGRNWVIGPVDAVSFPDPITAHNVALVMNGGASEKYWNQFIRRPREKALA